MVFARASLDDQTRRSEAARSAHHGQGERKRTAGVSCPETQITLSSPMTAITRAVRRDLAPTGLIRAGINYGNPVLAQRDATTGYVDGVAVDLARELGRSTGLDVELANFDAAGKVVDAVKTGVWDVAFLATDLKRATDLLFTPPYLLTEGTYLVRTESR